MHTRLRRWTLAAGQGEPITFTGYLASSQFYDSHDTIMGAKGLELGVTTAVAIQSMSFDQAAAVVDGDGARIDVKQWSLPLQPETGAGSVDLDEVDSERTPTGSSSASFPRPNTSSTG